MKRAFMTAAMLVAGTALMLPGTASAWEGFCSVDLEKCIRVDDGDEIIGEEPCLDMVDVEVGDEISWVIEVSNPSEFVIAECQVVDADLAYQSSVFSLDPGESETFMVGGTVDVCADFQNTAVVTCSVCGVEDVTDFMDQDTAELECEEECDVDLDKCIRVDDGDMDVGEEPCLETVEVEEGDEVDWVIEVSNPSSYAIGGCQVVDEALEYTSETFMLEAGADRTFEVAGTVEVCEDFSNTAVVTCTMCAGETVSDFTDQDTAYLECEEEGEGCLTRTPGYWGNHPAVTALFLPITTCGETFSSTMAGVDESVTAAICISGRVARYLGTSMQQLQLRRQCAAAHLNLAATGFFNGSCEAEYEELADTLAYCCEEVCAGGFSGAGISESMCIEMIDRFNNSYSYGLDEMSLCPNYELGTMAPCAADPTQCQAARHNVHALPEPPNGPPPSVFEHSKAKKTKALRRR